MKMIYIAGPFRGPSGWAIKENIHAAEQAAARIIEDGRAFPVTPHSLCAHFHGHGSDAFWINGTLELMRRCDAIFALSTWEKSIGATGEVAEAMRLGLPVFYSHDQLLRWLAL